MAGRIEDYAIVGDLHTAALAGPDMATLRTTVPLHRVDGATWADFVVAGRQVGNFPQAFSHQPLISSARQLSYGITAAATTTAP